MVFLFGCKHELDGLLLIAVVQREENGLRFNPSEMHRETFRKREHINKRLDFIKRRPGEQIADTRKYRFVLKPNRLSYSRLGIVVTKREGNAVFRNRTKRVIREAFRNNKNLINPPSDLIVINRQRQGRPTFWEAEQAFKTAIKQFQEKAKRT